MNSAHARIPIPNGPATIAPPSTLLRPAYNVSIGYLRAFITLLVIAHHAALAYHSYAPPVPVSLLAQPRWWQAFPVVDAQRWSGFTVFVGFNDIFFMSLMFFISGLFVWKSLTQKGTTTFLRDRLLRLGLPFLFAAALIAPLAYYPTYLQTGGHGLAGFWQQWRALGNWPAGPAWFVWVLLLFDVIAAALYTAFPHWGEGVGRLSVILSRRPIAFLGTLVALSAAVYLPLAQIYSPLYWSSFGPFSFQTSRLLHYLVYFLIGVGVGACGLDQGLLDPAGPLTRRWWLWCLRALFAFGITMGAVIAITSKTAPSLALLTFGNFTFALACATISLACLSVFLRFARSRSAMFDSLTINAYGMYLIHYAFVSWLQYALLKSTLPGIAKGSLVVLSAIALSWVATAALRRIPAVARVI